MAWFKGYPGLVGIVNAVVAAPPAPTEAPERETYQPAPYVPPPVKPPRKSGISRGLLYAGIGVTAFGLAAVAAVFGSRAATQQPQPTPTATAAAVATSTPVINDWYYTPVAPESTPTKPVPQATPTSQLIIPFITPSPIPTPTRYYPMPEPTETPVPTTTPTLIDEPTPVPTATPMPGLENLISEQLIVKYVTNWQTKQLITPELLAQIDSVNKTLYHRFTGKTFESSKFVTKLLTFEEYKVLEGKPGGTIPNSNGTIGVMPDHTINVYALSHLGKSVAPLDVLATLLHETGNAEAERRDHNFGLGITDLNKFYAEVTQKHNLGDISDLNIHLIERESLQALYRAAGFHHFEEIGAISSRNSLTDAERKEIDATVDAIVNSKNFFPQATLLTWYRALKESETKESLQKTGRITSQQAINLFDHYASGPKNREELEQRVVEIVTSVRTAPHYAQQIKDATKLSNRVANPDVAMAFVFIP